MTLRWFLPVSRAELSDAEFLKSVGITFHSPIGEATFRREEGTNDFVCEVGRIFTLTDGRVIIRPTREAGERAKETLLQIALDCVELDHHKSFGWLYKRKTSKRPGYWYSTVWMKVDPEGRSHEALATCEDFLTPREQRYHSHAELAPEIRQPEVERV